jgi:hypothetical protein
MQNGRIRPCCVIEENMGNIVGQTFKEIRFGKKYRTLKKRIISSNPPQKCITCISRSLTTLSPLKPVVSAKAGLKQGLMKNF